MIKGLYSAVTAMVMNATRQQTLSHNIANLQTPGFKQILNTVGDFMQNQGVYVKRNPGSNALDWGFLFTYTPWFCMKSPTVFRICLNPGV